MDIYVEKGREKERERAREKERERAHGDRETVRAGDNEGTGHRKSDSQNRSDGDVFTILSVYTARKRSPLTTPEDRGLFRCGGCEFSLPGMTTCVGRNSVRRSSNLCSKCNPHLDVVPFFCFLGTATLGGNRRS